MSEGSTTLQGGFPRGARHAYGLVEDRADSGFRNPLKINKSVGLLLARCRGLESLGLEYYFRFDTDEPVGKKKPRGWLTPYPSGRRSRPEGLGNKRL